MTTNNEIQKAVKIVADTPMDKIGFPCYSITKTGRVFSCKRKSKVELKPTDRNGYKAVTLVRRDGKPKTVNIHRLMAIVFLGDRGKGMQVNHINGNKHHNFLSNLEWTTPSQNSRHAIANGLTKPKIGEDSHFSKLNIGQVLLIKKMTEKGLSQRNIAKKFKISQATVSDIKTGKRWAKAIEALRNERPVNTGELK
ncbi:MAG: endodeoxyribonuclease [Halobacteriovoraceae bacterium]|nr:endodeoxyribonuclease [Halobacteriovoraceae bacterium]|tara:strand:+ start:24021 stop:24608 length:588 start_codon:yes stop_codon:yes gene_type:complete